MNRGFGNITQILNDTTRKSIRWCTPSIEIDHQRVKNIYESDMSVSFEGLGFPSEPSGIFLDAYRKAAIAYGADKTLFSVNGSTGCNFIVLRTLSKQIPNLRILAQRNIHKSVLNACLDYGINLLFTDSYIDSRLQIFLPNSIKEITQAIKKTKPHVFLITSPTYEGLAGDLKKLIQIIRSINPKIIIFVDEAWGAHLAFSDNLPISSMKAGADICVQSTHKQGGSLQQGAMIHWKEERIHSDLILESYRNLSTSSPSYLLLSSLDAAREQMEKEGKAKIDKCLKIADKLTVELEKIPDFKVIKLSQLKKRSNSVYEKDETKVILDISRSGFTGFELSRYLEEEYNIIVEKYNATTILLLVTFKSKIENINKTVDAFKEILRTKRPLPRTVNKALLEIPRNIPRILELGDVTKLLQNQIERIQLKDAKGRISAENITPYPPGIPTTIQGEEFTSKTIDFYQTIHHYPNIHVLAHDTTLKTVLVVK